MLEDVDSLPVCQQAGARSRLEDQLEAHYEEWYRLQEEQDEVKENIFESVGYVPLLKEEKEKLEFESFMNEAWYYMDLVGEQTQQWLDKGCPEDDGEEWMN
ncbi:hypothetical protein GOV10_05495 [Candidatus Woesearchaeota archaeon]|nr:hypothetical protein [Candidatus Woesearchaeota archaeon]